MTLEELRAMRKIANTDGRPPYSLTDDKWQEEFRIRRLFVKPIGKKSNYMGGQHSKESGRWNEEYMGEYNGETGWHSYVRYINDVLKNIRAGEVDYCYFIYQIMELLRFHRDDLRTRYCDGYWEVWLER